MNRLTEIRAPLGARLMETHWTDGTVGLFRHVVLRGFCPCAVCQGHEGPIAWVEPPNDQALELADIEEVGQYGLKLGWADGHNTGIYPFTFLERLAVLYDEPEASINGRTFSR